MTLCLSMQQATAQMLIVQDSINHKQKKIKPGKTIGLITYSDTIHWNHFSNDSGKYFSTNGGVFELQVEKTNPETIRLLNRIDKSSSTYHINDIKFVTFPKERHDKYRYGVALLGVFGTLAGSINLVRDLIQQKPVGPSMITLSVGITSFGFLYLTRKWYEVRKYRILRMD